MAVLSSSLPKLGFNTKRTQLMSLNPTWRSQYYCFWANLKVDLSSRAFTPGQIGATFSLNKSSFQIQHKYYLLTYLPTYLPTSRTSYSDQNHNFGLLACLFCDFGQGLNWRNQGAPPCVPWVSSPSSSSSFPLLIILLLTFFSLPWAIKGWGLS